MSVNPYESPRAIANSNHLPKTARCPELISAFVVSLAAIAGGSMFLATIYGMAALALHSIAFQVSLVTGIAAIYIVQMAADAHIRQEQPAWGAPIIGMLLASPIALVVGVYLAFVAYGMGTKNVPGAEFVAWFNLSFFSLTLSFGGWLAVCRTPRVVILGDRFSN